MVSGDDFMRSATLVTVTENFRQSDISGKKTFCPSCIRRIDQVKTWKQKFMRSEQTVLRFPCKRDMRVS